MVESKPSVAICGIGAGSMSWYSSVVAEENESFESSEVSETIDP